MDTKTLFGALLIVGFVGGFSINSYFMDNETIENNIIDVEVGNEAPNFTITDTEGNSFNLSDFENEKVVVLEFMNMGCGSCHNFEKNVLKSYCNNTTMPEDVKVISITQTEDEYENLIIDYASQPLKLKKINEKLNKNKNNKPLFNTQQYTRDFELSMHKIHEIYLNGEKPVDIILN